MTIFIIFCAVCVLSALVAVGSAVFAWLRSKENVAAQKALHAAKLRMDMTAAFEIAVKQAQLMDASQKALEIRLGRRAPTGTRLSHGKI